MKKKSLHAAAALLALFTVPGFAQTAPTPTIDTFPSKAHGAVTETVLPRMSAVMAPVVKSSAISGQISFLPAGEEVSLFGRVGGLQPDSRYQLLVMPAGGPAETAKSPVVEKPGQNTADTTVTGSPPAPLGKDLGMIVADANGTATVDTTLKKSDMAKFPDGLPGGTVILKRAQPLNTEDERPEVATGRIVVAASDVATPAPR